MYQTPHMHADCSEIEATLPRAAPLAAHFVVMTGIFGRFQTTGSEIVNGIGETGGQFMCLKTVTGKVWTSQDVRPASGRAGLTA